MAVMGQRAPTGRRLRRRVEQWSLVQARWCGAVGTRTLRFLSLTFRFPSLDSTFLLWVRTARWVSLLWLRC
jgi:hypothetical protein